MSNRQNSKTYALYGAPKVVKPKTENKYKHLLLKVKNYFGLTGNKDAQHTYESSIPSSNLRKSVVPGGFFTADSSFMTQLRSNLSTADVSMDNSLSMMNESNSCNTTLARFFESKGSEPLSEVEMEGVLSIMKKSQGKGQFGSDSVLADDSGFLQGEQKTLGMRTASKALTEDLYTPHYDSEVSSTKQQPKKRVFDFSAIPSPYKAGGIYKPHTLLSKEEASEPEASSELFAHDNSILITKKEPKKLSSTASTLMTLLADRNELKKDINKYDAQQKSKKSQPADKLSNPYTTYIPEVKPLKQKLPKVTESIPDFKNTHMPKTTVALPKPSEIAEPKKTDKQPITETPKETFAFKKSEPESVADKYQDNTKKSAFTFSFTNSSAPVNTEKKEEKKEEIKLKNTEDTKSLDKPSMFLSFAKPTKDSTSEPVQETKQSFSFNTESNLEKENEQPKSFGKVYNYNFPDPVVISVNDAKLDKSKTEAYKSMFTF